MVGRGKVGRDREGLMHIQFIRWLGIGGRGKVGRDWGGERNTQFSFQTHFDYALFHLRAKRASSPKGCEAVEVRRTEA